MSETNNFLEINQPLSWFKEDRYRIIDDYLTLIQKCLVGTLYEDPQLEVLGNKIFDPQKRELGLDWPSIAPTMIGQKRLENIRILIEMILKDGIKGDFIETGVWRGGACIFMRAVLNAYGIKDRIVWLADSFQGLPQPNGKKYPADKDTKFHTYTELSVSLEQVKHNFKKYGLLDGQVKFLKGWFKDTLPNSPIKKLALLRLDGDLYESTMDALQALYGKVSIGGFIIVDDYHVVESCKCAVHDFIEKQNLNPVLEEIDGSGVYWRVF